MLGADTLGSLPSESIIKRSISDGGMTISSTLNNLPTPAKIVFAGGYVRRMSANSWVHTILTAVCIIQGSDAEVIPHTLRYIAETARFEKYLDVGSNS